MYNPHQEGCNAAYDRAAYDLSIDYRDDPEPPRSAADTAWAKRILRDQRGR